MVPVVDVLILVLPWAVVMSPVPTKLSLESRWLQVLVLLCVDAAQRLPHLDMNSSVNLGCHTMTSIVHIAACHACCEQLLEMKLR